MRILTAIVGPTGVGKTQISIGLAKALDAEIISSDSMQVYRKMNIGTAKITPEETEGIPHHLLDICSPLESFSAAEFQVAAYRTMEEIWSRGRQPLLVGGTGLYLNAVIYGYNFSEEAVDTELRSQLFADAERLGNAALLQRLSLLDPKAAARLHTNDTKRIVRALEVALASPKPLTTLESESRIIDFKPLVFGLRRERGALYSRINRRVDLMLEEGLVEEVRDLWQKGQLGPAARQALGYKEVIDYLRGRSTYHEMVTVLKRETRRYAKRQMTWFRKNREIIWFDLDESSDPQQIITLMAAEHAGLSRSAENI